MSEMMLCIRLRVIPAQDPASNSFCFSTHYWFHKPLFYSIPYYVTDTTHGAQHRPTWIHSQRILSF